MKRGADVRSALYLAMGLLALLWQLPAQAWGSQGHHVVARLAETQLSPAARSEVQRLLALEPGASMENISTWADNNRDTTTGPWHYVNLPRGNCHYEAARDCPQGQCVVEAIEQQSKVLASNAPDAERLLALKYLVHFMGDVHQPLHAGHEDDRGGNRYQLQAFMAGTNLHAIWDTTMIRQLEESNARMAQRLQSSITPPTGTLLQASAAEMAEASCHIVATPGFYPGRALDMAYLEKFMPVLEQQLVFAGARLATLLNRLLPPR